MTILTKPPTLLSLLIVLSLAALAAQGGEVLAAEEQDDDKNDKKGPSFSGNASWYGPPFHGRKTASGEIFDMNKHTCAHRKLPFKTKILVEDPRTGKTIVVRVNDRGPYAKGRVLDMAKEAARKLGTIGRGVFYIDCLVIDDDQS